MKKISKIATLLILGVSLFSCKKDDEFIPVYYYKNIIELTSNYQILKVSNYIGEELHYTKQFNYSENLVEIIQADSMNTIYLKSTYFINSIGLADSCIDSSFSNQALKKISISKFNYDEFGYKTAAKFISKSISSDTVLSAISVDLSYTLQNGNVSSFSINGGLYATYEYSAQKNKIDIFSFLGDYSGKKNENLMTAEHFQYHSSPSTAPPFSYYSYMLNQNGFVTECDELYTSSYHTINSEPSQVWRITAYVYIFR